MFGRRALLLVCCVVIGLPGTARAQELSGLVKRLFDEVTKNAFDPGGIDHTSHFFLGGEQVDHATRQLNVALVEQLALFPLASSSGGFTFALNDRGEVLPTSTTFGPSFAERAVTIGRQQLNFGFTYQRTSYDSFEGVELDSGGLRIFSEHNDCCPATNRDPQATTDFNPAFERDLLLSTLRATIVTNTTAFFANYGVTDRFDIGVAVPIVNVKVDATVDAEILRTATASTPLTHSFDGLGASTRSVSDSGSASGLGDVLLRAKYNLFRSNTTAFAAALDLRLPTGDENNLLGAGATQTQAFLVASGEYGRFSPHVNIGYTFSRGELSSDAADVDDPTGEFGPFAAGVDESPLDLSAPDQLNFTAGFNIAAGPRVTLGFDVRGRTLREVLRFSSQNIVYANRGPGVLPTASFTAEGEFVEQTGTGNLTSMLGVVGGKINLGGTFLLNLTVLFPLTDDGLKPKPTPVIGFDYVF